MAGTFYFPFSSVFTLSCKMASLQVGGKDGGDCSVISPRVLRPGRCEGEDILVDSASLVFHLH